MMKQAWKQMQSNNEEEELNNQSLAAPLPLGSIDVCSRHLVTLSSSKEISPK